MRNLLTKISMAVFTAMASAGAMAGNFTQVPDPASVAQGATVNVAFQFAGDAVTQEAQLDLNYNNTVFTTVVPTTVVAGSTCAVNASPPFIRIVPPSGAGTALTSTPTTYCSFAFTAAPAAAAANYDFTTRVLECDGPTCTRTGTFRITVTGAVTPVGPSIAYNPPAGAAAGTGGPVTFTGVTTIGSTGAGQIVATPSAGAVAGTATTVGNFTLAGAEAGFFAVTSAATLTFPQGTNTPQNINLTCTSGAAARTANLQATETITGGNTTQRFWVLNCPAGSAVMATAPTLTYIPAPSTSTPPPGGPFTPIAYGASANISVLCASPSPDGSTCGGTGTGDSATTRLQNISVAYIGPSFSPNPSNLSCVFANQSNTTVVGPLNFVAQTADPGNIRCTCANLPTFGDNYRVSVQEVRPVGGTTTPRNFDITCGGNVACGTLNLTPGTLTLTPNAAAANIIGVSLTGASANVNRTVACTTSAPPAGSTFTLTTNPSPLTVSTTPNVTGNVLAACTNTATTAATVTVTCSNTSNTQNCATTPSTFELTCPGQGTPPPPSEFIAVPTLNEQGRILLAALVLLLGMGVVGFRMRG